MVHLINGLERMPFGNGEWGDFHNREAALHGLGNIDPMRGRGLDYEVHLNWTSEGAQTRISCRA